MFGLFWIIIGVAVVVLLALLVILISEIRNNRRYTLQQTKDYVPQKQKKTQKRKPPRRETQPEPPVAEVQEEAPEAVSAYEETAEALAAEETAAPEAITVAPEEQAEAAPVEIETVEAPETEPAVERTAEAAEEEAAAYPAFDNSRAVEQLGLSQEEADLFMPELIGQIEDELPNLDAAIEANDVEKVEQVSHMLKGSATNLGTGGVSDVLVDFNTYCKTGTDLDIIRGHMSNLRFHLDRLKEQFPD